MILSVIFDLKLYKIMKGKMFRIFGGAVNGRIEAGNWLVGHSTSGQQFLIFYNLLEVIKHEFERSI